MEKIKKWIKKAGMRAVRTIAQSAIATIGAAAVFAEVDWKMVVSAALLAGVLSMLNSIVSLPEAKEEE